MNVTIKKFDVGMEVKTKGIEFEVRSADGIQHLGDLILTKTQLVWCKGRTRRSTGQKVSWGDFIAWMEGS